MLFFTLDFCYLFSFYSFWSSTHLIIVQLLLCKCCNFITHCFFSVVVVVAVVVAVVLLLEFFDVEQLQKLFTIYLQFKSSTKVVNVISVRRLNSNSKRWHKVINSDVTLNNIYSQPASQSDNVFATESLRSESICSTLCAIAHIAYWWYSFPFL